MGIGCATQFSEHWMEKILEFLGGYPEEVRNSWKESLNPEIKVQAIDGIPYGTLYNPWREKRVSLREKLSVPDYYESIKRYHKSQKNTVIFGEDYEPYYILVNIFPLMANHVTVAHDSYNRDMQVNKRVEEKDLETVLKIQRRVPGLAIWHNMVGTAATFEYWEHFQGICFEPPIRSAAKKSRDSHSGIYTMSSYPGSNILFNSRHRIRNSLDLINKLYDKRISHTLLIDDGYIYVVPVKDENAGSCFGLNEKSRLGGFETCGYYVALSWDDFEKFKKGDITPRDVLAQGLFKREELDLFDLV